MYHLQPGFVPETRKLCNHANLKQSREGYATTHSPDTISIFQPLLKDIFPGEWTYCIVAAVMPGGHIPPHQDGNASTSGSRRYHLVLQTNPDAWTLHDGTWQHLLEGHIYTMDPLKTHAAINWGIEPRIHLVIDVRGQ